MRSFPLDVAACFAENLIRCRKRAGLSQDELAYRASLHRTEISLLERGARTPRIDTLIKLAASLSVSPEKLLAGIAWEPGSVRAGALEVSAHTRTDVIARLSETS